MKKKIVILLGVVFALVLSFALTACGKVALKLTFKVDGEVYQTISTSGNEVISMPENPTKDGFIFDGWFWDEGTWQKPFTANSLLDTPLSSDMSVYAKFVTEHVHEYSVKNASPEYLATPATCTEKAKYYYSCSCGEKGTETFESGEISSEHPYDGTWSSNETYHFHKSTCIHGIIKDKEKHNFGTGRVCEICEYLTSDPIGTEIKADGFEQTSTAYYTKVSNDTGTFSFIGKIKVADGATWRLFTDIACTVEVPSRTKEISVGDNKFYILVTNGNDVNPYPFVVRRRPIYTVTYHTNGGTAVASERVEEDSFATEPTTTRTGYTFKAWNYDFTQPIVDNATISASWDTITYNISYDLAGGDFSGDYPQNYNIETATFSLVTPVKRGYTFLGWYDGDTKVTQIKKESTGDRSLAAKWEIDVYRITYTVKYGTNNANNVSTYTVNDEVKFFDPYYINGDFIKWQDENGNKITKIEKGSIGDVSITAVYDLYDVKLNLNNDDTFTVVGKQTESDTVNIKAEYKDKKVASIGERAFYNCSSLTSVTIPDSVTSIGDSAFSGCSSLTSVHISNLTAWLYIDFFSYSSNPLSCAHNLYLSNELVTELIIPDGITKIKNYAFNGCSSLTSVTIPNSVTSIERGVFSGCSKLTSVTIPDSATNIGYSAFGDCRSLTSITIGNSVKSIEGRAFRNCSSLTSVTIPNSVSSIGSEAFYSCSRLTSVHIRDLTAWCNIAFIDYLSNPLSYAHNLYLNGQLVTELVIPDGITEIKKYAFNGCSSLTSVTIPDSVTSIGNSAFRNCSSLTSVTIPDSVTSIGSRAFEDCSSLTGVTIPNSVTSIRDYAFYGCSSLTSVTIPDSVTSIRQYAFYNCSSLTSVTIPDSVTSIRDYAFYNCSSLTSVTIPDSVTSIGWTSFSGCPIETATIPAIACSIVNNSSLKTVVITSGKSIGSEAFRYCSGLTSVTIPDNVTSIGDSAFYSCRSLTSITIPDSVTNIGDSAFYNCSKLTSVTIGNSVTSIGERAFYNCSKLTSVTIGNSVTSIGQYAFYNCPIETATMPTTAISSIPKTKLKTVIITTGKGIWDSAFKDCSSLTSITIPNSVTSIGERAFRYCSGLTSITIPDSVTSIGDWAFYGCSSLTSVAIPDSVTSIGYSAFSDCSSLTSVTIPDSVTSIEGGAFDGCPIETATMPTTVISSIPKTKLKTVIITTGKSIWDSAFYDCSSLTSITIGNSVTSIGSNAFRDCSSLTSVTIPDSVTSIGDYAFGGCSSLTSITIGNSVTSIGSNAFRECSSLTSVTIPNSVTSIGGEAFYNCSSLTSVTIGNSVTSIGERAFYNCISLNCLTVDENNSNYKSIDGNLYTKDGTTLIQYAIGKTETSFTIPNSVTYISDSAFYNCSSLTSVTIPNSVTSIGSSAFGNCSSLTKVYYKGTAEEWDSIVIKSYGNNDLISATRYYYSETEPTDDGNYWRYVDGVPTVWTKEN